MSLILLNSQSNQRISLDTENPLIIGRNNVLGCFDKKVSRSHGRITCTENGKINLVALHTNPCFFMKNGVPPIRQLNKDEEETLNEGDCLGLLPNSFWFQILSSKNVKIKKEPEEASSESCRQSETENVRDSEPSSSGAKDTEDFTTGSSDYSKRLGSPEFEKTRRLPLSVYDTDQVVELDSFLSTNDEIKPKKLKLDNDCDTARLCTDNNGENGQEPSTSKPTTCVDETLEGDIKSDEKINATKGEGSSGKTELGKVTKKPFCKYEHNCFRKNPQHKIDFCHPGDPDYVPYEKRPVCPFGAACYRRSDKHRVEFRHPRGGSPDSSSDERLPGVVATSPLPAKRRRKTVKRNSYYEDEDEYDLEDPFIDDASSDEYVPSDSDSEEDWGESQET